jgi:hypothetical protein
MEYKGKSVIVDYEDSMKKRREVMSLDTTKPFEQAIERIRFSSLGPKVVQFIDSETGEVVKGPLYDQTKYGVNVYDIMKYLKPGVQKQLPIEPTQHEPRDRFQENKHMNTEKQKFQSLVKECIAEIKMESDPKLQLKESLRKVVKNILKEIASGTLGKSAIPKEDNEKIQKGYAKVGNERLDKTNIKLMKELETIVHGINADWDVYWDDRFDLNVDAKNLLRVRITPKFENNFDIDAMVKLTDRIRVIAVTWDQVKDFVKENFNNLENKTVPDKLKDRSMAQGGDRDVIKKAAGPVQSDIKNRGEKNNGEDAKIKDTKRDDKNYNEKQVSKDEDQPDQPMKSVVDAGKDPESKNKNIDKTPQVKPQKQKKEDGSDKLKTSLPATKKFRARK